MKMMFLAPSIINVIFMCLFMVILVQAGSRRSGVKKTHKSYDESQSNFGENMRQKSMFHLVKILMAKMEFRIKKSLWRPYLEGTCGFG